MCTKPNGMRARSASRFYTSLTQSNEVHDNCEEIHGNLVCLVELGKTKIQRKANHEAEASMKSSCFMGMLGVKSFDSITAPALPHGSVRVPEYTVFKPSQVLPQYLLCVR